MKITPPWPVFVLFLFPLYLGAHLHYPPSQAARTYEKLHLFVNFPSFFPTGTMYYQVLPFPLQIAGTNSQYAAKSKANTSSAAAEMLLHRCCTGHTPGAGATSWFHVIEVPMKLPQCKFYEGAHALQGGLRPQQMAATAGHGSFVGREFEFNVHHENAP